jgi:hypothetical protein
VISCTAPILLFEYDNPNTSGDHAALMDDWIEFNQDPANFVTIAVSGLSNGSYDVFTYSMVMDIGSSSSIGGQAVSGFPWSGDLVQGVSYARHQIDVTSGSFALTLASTDPFFGLAAWNGMQIVKLDGTFDSFCDGTSGNCPCANNGAPGHGCANSFDPNGALLSAQGSASVAGDTLVLDASGVSNSVVTFFQGRSAVQGGAGVAFGDGLRCAGGATIRLGAKLASGNQAHYPGGADAAVSVRGAIPAGGAERTYQVWYRNASSFCTPSTFNLTNAVRVMWAP